MNAAGRARLQGGNGGLGRGPIQQNRRVVMPTTPQGGRYAKSTLPPCSLGNGERRRISSGVAHGGAGGDGGNVDWRTPLTFSGGAGVGRRLGGNSVPNNVATRTSRLDKPTIASSMRAASNRLAVKQQRERAAAAVAAIMVKHEKIPLTSKSKSVKWDVPLERKRITPSPPIAPNQDNKKEKVSTVAAKQPTRSRLLLQRKAAGNSGLMTSILFNNDKAASKEPNLVDTCVIEKEVEPKVQLMPTIRLVETGIQTNEAEILNHDLLVGDVKLIKASPTIIEQINKTRLESKAKLDKQTMRKFSVHEQHEEMHLNELKEFMERNCVTKRIPKKPVISLHNYEQNNVFKSMDEMFTREIPKTESITNIKERIKRKEQELMSLFDDVELNDRVNCEYEELC